MSYLGDFRLGDTFDTKFTTRQISGAPFTLGGVPVISAYPSNSTTELTAGITLTVDFDARTGLNHVRVVATSGNGYATATDYQLVITTGTVNSVSVVGEVIGEFSIEHRSALMPTTAARTLVVDASGLADANMVKAGPTGSGTAQTAGDIFSKVTGLTFTVANQVDVNVKDWAGAAVASAAAGIPKVDIDTIKTNPVVNGGTITFPTTATLASTTNITAGTITTTTNLTNLPSIPANWLTAAGINAGALNGKGDWLLASSYTAPLSAAATATAVWTDTTASDFVVALSVGKSVMNGVSLGTGLTINAYAGNTPQTADVGAAATQNAFADALLARNVAGGSSAGRIVKEAFYFLRNKWTVSTGTLTVFGTDDTTVVWTASVSSDATASPIVGSDPA